MNGNISVGKTFMFTAFLKHKSQIMHHNERVNQTEREENVNISTFQGACLNDVIQN